jgi:hypothetical protein
LGPEYDIASKTAVVLNIISSCFLYSGGIPLLNIICFVSLFLIYWIEKILVVNHYRAPPAYDHGVNQQLQAILPYAVLLHCGFSLYMYGSDSIWPREYYQNSDGIIVGKDVDIEGRIKHYTGIILIILMIATACLVFFSYALASLILKLLRSSLAQTRNILPEYNHAKFSLHLRGIASYSIASNPEYSSLIQALEESVTNREFTASNSSRGRVGPEPYYSGL